jgi:nitrate reductase gamma subunit
MNDFPLSIFYFLFNVILFILSTILLIIRIKRWGVSYPFVKLVKELFKEKRLKFSSKLKAIINTLIKDLLSLKRAGYLCEENFHLYGRALLIYGFGGIVIMNLINFILNPIGVPLGYLHPLSIITYLFYAFLAIGSFMLFLRRLIRSNLRKTTDPLVLLLHLSLFYFAVVGISFYSSLNSGLPFLSSILFYIYLSGISLLYLFLPLSEVGYYIWKASMLLTKSLLIEHKSTE